MAFDDLTKRMGKRHGIAAELVDDPAALERKLERNRYQAMFFGGIAIVAIMGALTLALATTGWWMPEASGSVLLAGCLAIGHGARGLRRMRRQRPAARHGQTG